MKNLVRRSGIVGIGLIWAAGWVIAGMAIEALSNMGIHLPIEPLADVWPTAIAIPGILGGVVFSAIVWIAERRGLDAPSPARFGAWGALAGLLIGLLGVVAGLATDLYPDPWVRAAMIIGITTVLGAVSGAGAAVVFRFAESEQTLASTGAENRRT